MKRLFIFSTFLLLLLSTTFPQQSGNTIKPNLKYGKPSKEELSLNSYAPDTTATAIYLFRMGESKFVYKDGFQLVTEHWVRIKVLKPQGVSYADVTIPYYSPSDKDRGQERASEINGCSYHLENGQCIETPLKRDHISDERVNQHIRLLKFSIPSVKVGSVIEYHYKLYSDYFAHIDNWMMQDELPMIKHTIVIVVMLWGAIIAIGGMMSYLFPYIKTPKQPLKEKGMIRTLYLNSEIIIPQIYCWYFVIYITFSLEFKSILYNYLMLLLTGLFLGYKTTMKVNKYTLEEAYRKKQEHKKQKRNK